MAALPGQPVKLRVTLQSNFDAETDFELIVADQGYAQKHDLKAAGGVQTLELEHTFQSAGLHELLFSVTCEPDTETKNNQLCSYINIPVLENILILESIQGESSALVELLKDKFTVTVVDVKNNADAVPGTVKELSAYEQVILVNISNQDLTAASMPANFDQTLYDYVFNLGGCMLTVGGQNDTDDAGNRTPHAYNRKDMAGTLFQQMLPVQAIDYAPPLAVMLVIDCSGSMSSGRFDAALSGAEECLDSL